MKWRKGLAAVFWTVVLAAFFTYTHKTGQGPLETARRLVDFVRSSSSGPLIFIALYTVRPVFLFSAALLTIAAGALFGPVWGTLYSIVGSNLGAALAFFIGRFFGEGLVDVSSEGKLGGFVARMRERSFETVFLMRLLFLPYDLVNYLAGLLRINFWAFLAATALGSIPGTISFVLFGVSSGLQSGGPDFDPRVLAASIAIFLLSIGVSRILRKREEKRE